MSFPDTLTLADSVPANRAFTKTSDDGSSTIYSDDASTIGLPTTLTIMHKIAKVGVDGVDRHTVKFSAVNADENGKLAYLPVTISINKPRVNMTELEVQNAVAILKSFLTSARITQLLRGEN